MEIRPYLTFKNGSCSEAIELYTKAFNTEVLEIMRASDIPSFPNGPSIPESQKNWIMQATIKFGNNFIRLSDCFGEPNDPESERLSIIVEGTVNEVKQAFDTLSKEGRVGIPLSKTFFSPSHGVVFDKFGVMWNLMAVK